MEGTTFKKNNDFHQYLAIIDPANLSHLQLGGRLAFTLTSARVAPLFCAHTQSLKKSAYGWSKGRQKPQMGTGLRLWAKYHISPRRLEGLDRTIAQSVSEVNEVIFNREVIIQHKGASEWSTLPLCHNSPITDMIQQTGRATNTSTVSYREFSGITERWKWKEGVRVNMRESWGANAHESN